MFEKATRLKLRFESPKGLLSVEDLWDLPLSSATGKANLDDLARYLHAQVSKQSVSFVETKSAASDADQLRFDILLHIIKTRLDENERKLQAQAKKEQKAKLYDILERKRDAQLENASIEEIQAMINAL